MFGSEPGCSCLSCSLRGEGRKKEDFRELELVDAVVKEMWRFVLVVVKESGRKVGERGRR